MRALRYDCDGDALLALVEPAGPACHTGERTCFHRGELEPPAPHEALPGARAHDRRARGGGARRLLHGARCSPTRRSIGEKVQEEAEEVARAAREETDERVAEEAADVLYHLAVLLRGRGLSLADAEEVLSGRRALSIASCALTGVDRRRRSTRCARSPPSTTSSRSATRSSRTARRRSPRS